MCIQIVLKVPPQSSVITCLISDSFHKKSNLSYIHYDMLAHLYNFLLVFVNSSDKLLNYFLLCMHIFIHILQIWISMNLICEGLNQ